MVQEKILFTKEDCQWLLDHALEYVESTVSYDFERTKSLTRIANPKDRISQQCELGEPQGTIKEFLTEKLKPIGIVNLDKAFLNYVRYFKGGHFAKHIDGPERYKTCIIQLTDPSKYSGGNLLVKDRVIGKQLGNTVIFGSNITHELTLVEEGQRDVLVVWTAKGNTLEKKSLI